MVEPKKILDAEDITKIFGIRSKIYSESMKLLERFSVSHKAIYDDKYKKWESVFKNIYGDDVDDNLFLNHTYFALILKILLLARLNIIQNLDLDDAFNDCKTNNLESLQIFEFGYFNWAHLSKRIFKLVYNNIEGITFSREDLFQELYQQLIFAVTRHKIGEFYTPNKLVKKMVDEIYQLGDKVLDPSCGSGSFLIEVMIRILNSEISDSKKLDALKNIYGFDINPLAAITVKINILLLFLGHFDYGKDVIPSLNIFLIDSLFPQESEEQLLISLKENYSSFDLIIGNPPWLTYKDLTSKDYQTKILGLAERLEIKPASQYITHIELAAIFFYAIPSRFLKVGGKIFFVVTKSVLNGDHCHKFRAFSIFRDLEIWDFPNHYFFKIDHICLKAEFIENNDNVSISDKYPINTKIFNEDLELLEETYYSSFKIEEDGAKSILPESELEILNRISYSPYKKQFFQGATLVPRTLVFFQIEKKNDNTLIISSDPDVMSRAKKTWHYYFQNKEIETDFYYKTFLNKDLIPFKLTKKRNVFLPINQDFEFKLEELRKYPKAFNFYNEMNEIYQERKKKTSDINTLFANLNYWNKLTKQAYNENYLVVYNASGANIKSAVVINRKHNLIIGSENYYFSTNSKLEAYYLSGILNSPILSKNIKIIKSSRHIHKRPFSFPIPLYDEDNELHRHIGRNSMKCETYATDLLIKNPNINSDKVRIILTKKLQRLNSLVEEIVFD